MKKKNNKNVIKKSLSFYNLSNFKDDYKIIGRFCNLSFSKKDWIETTRYKLQASANKYERLVGEYLISKNISFIHQAPFMFDDKIYFSDFFIPKMKLIIEVDGDYHNSIMQSENDEERDVLFSSIGIKTVRINNNETLNRRQIEIRISIA